MRVSIPTEQEQKDLKWALDIAPQFFGTKHPSLQAIKDRYTAGIPSILEINSTEEQLAILFVLELGARAYAKDRPGLATLWGRYRPAAPPEKPPEAPAPALGLVQTSESAAKGAYVVYMASLKVPVEWVGSIDDNVTGVISENAIRYTTACINAYRTLCGLEHVTEDPYYSARAQAAAFVIASNPDRGLTHSITPDWKNYSPLAASGCSGGNISRGHLAGDAIKDFMQDLGFVNTDLGHRRWFLYPGLREVGVGFVDQAGTTEDAACIYVMGGHNDSIKQPVAWPNAGYCPRYMVPYRWSYSHPGANFISARVFVDGKEHSPISRNGHYGDPCIAWSVTTEFPPPSYREYKVEIKNISISGVTTNVEYTVRAFG